MRAINSKGLGNAILAKYEINIESTDTSSAIGIKVLFISIIITLFFENYFNNMFYTMFTKSF